MTYRLQFNDWNFACETAEDVESVVNAIEVLRPHMARAALSQSHNVELAEPRRVELSPAQIDVLNGDASPPARKPKLELAELGADDCNDRDKPPAAQEPKPSPPPGCTPAQAERRERIKEILAARPMSATAIHKKLDDGSSYASLYQVLKKMAKRGELDQPPGGYYRLPGRLDSSQWEQLGAMVFDWLATHGPATIYEISAGLGQYEDVISFTIDDDERFAVDDDVWSVVEVKEADETDDQPEPQKPVPAVVTSKPKPAVASHPPRPQVKSDPDEADPSDPKDRRDKIVAYLKEFGAAQVPMIAEDLSLSVTEVGAALRSDRVFSSRGGGYWNVA